MQFTLYKNSTLLCKFLLFILQKEEEQENVSALSILNVKYHILPPTLHTYHIREKKHFLFIQMTLRIFSYFFSGLNFFLCGV